MPHLLFALKRLSHETFFKLHARAWKMPNFGVHTSSQQANVFVGMHLHHHPRPHYQCKVLHVWTEYLGQVLAQRISISENSRYTSASFPRAVYLP